MKVFAASGIKKMFLQHTGYCYRKELDCRKANSSHCEKLLSEWRHVKSDVFLRCICYLIPPLPKIASFSMKYFILSTVKILKIGTPEIITIIVLQLEQLDFTVQYCVQKMQTE